MFYDYVGQPPSFVVEFYVQGGQLINHGNDYQLPLSIVNDLDELNWKW